MTKSNEILEALKMQPLTEEEKASRHILGRWYGPIATCNESTRNGRRYNKELWEKALNDELFQEKIANKCLFLELGHPTDREETDMSKVCACIPEMPKMVNGDLYAYVDILDTPNGKILKTLCDYGFVPGVSSRGSGDIMPNDDVDPETFYLETFDCVAIPAVKKARGVMCESLDTNAAKLRKALTESLNTASEEDKLIMKETLENLDINLTEESAEDIEKPQVTKRLTVEDIPWDPEDEQILTEDSDAETEEATVESEDSSAEQKEDSEEEKSEEEVEEAKASDEELEETGVSEEEPASEKDFEVATVGDFVEYLQEVDENNTIEFEVVTPDGEHLPVEEINTYENDDILTISMNSCDEEEQSSEDTDSDKEAQDNDDTASVETSQESEDIEDSADDNGDEEVIESLKEMIRQKEALETEVSDLRKAKTVGDAKEQELQEKLDRYRAAFRTVSAEAAKIPGLQSKIKELTEQLAQNNTTINALTEKVNKAQQLKENADSNKMKLTRLTEQLHTLTEKCEPLEAKLEGQTKQYNIKLQERTDLAKKYKVRFIETLTKYVESRANMLGVQPSEITSRLNESYTLKDVDAVCDEILDSAMNIGRLPFSGRTKSSIRINETVSPKRPSRYEEDDLSDLYELAGLK